MRISRLSAASSSLAFAVLCATLALVGRIPGVEAGWASASVALIFIPTGWWAPVGWRRRAAEAVMVFPAWALVMVADPVQRRMLLPPLLAAAGWAALAAAWPRIPEGRRVVSVIMLALAARAATGMGLLDCAWWITGLVFVAGAAAAWAATRVGGRDLGVGLALLTAAAPLQTSPAAAGVVLLIALVMGAIGPSRADAAGGSGWLPCLVGGGLFGMAFAAWGGLGLERILPGMGGWAIGAVVIAVVLTRILPPGIAGMLWFFAVFAVGPVVAPTPDRRGFVLEGELADVNLPVGTGAPYILDVGLDGAEGLAPGTAVAWFRVGDTTHRLVYPAHAVRRDGDGQTGPGRVWRPNDVDGGRGWRVSTRSAFEVQEGTVPRLMRHPDLPEAVTVVLETEGPALPTPPRSRNLGWWLTAAAWVVAGLQLFSGTWRRVFAVVPWAVLVTGALVVRAWVEPLRMLGERFAPDIALAAMLTAWLPAAVVWQKRRRVGVAVAALLVPLAMATPYLTPPLHGDEPFHLALMTSLVDDGDTDLDNNVDLEAHPQQASFQQDGDLLHSPVLGLLLLPGFAVAGRMGALLLLAAAGSLAVALISRRARRLGVPESRFRLLVIVLATTYPLAVFTGQIWVEVIGVLAVAAILVAVAGGRGGRWAAVAWALLATAIKTRLALLVFPAALAGWWGRRRGRLTGLIVLAGAAVASSAVGWLTMGHPFGLYRRLGDLLPDDPWLAGRVVGGLVFDPPGGLLFAAPLWLVAAAGLAALWRRGGHGERMLLVGCGLTVVALLHSIEWYGGGSPPARYLVPMLPAAALAGGLVLREPRRWRRAAEALVLPSAALWWVLVTRPHHSINPGDGSWWATDALARSYLVDTAWLAPSFLVPRAATVVVPLVVATVAAAVVFAARWRPSFARRFAAGSMAAWLLGAAGLIAAIELRTDRVVEAEAAQVRHHGGRPHPPEGTFSRFTHRRGWMMRDGQGITVPLNLPAGAEVSLQGWLLGTARKGAEIEVGWDGGKGTKLRVGGDEVDDGLRVPDPPGRGRHRLQISIRANPQGAVVLDRVVVRPTE